MLHLIKSDKVGMNRMMTRPAMIIGAIESFSHLVIVYSFYKKKDYTKENRVTQT